MASKMASRFLVFLPLLASCSIYQSGSLDQSSLSSGCSVSDIDRYIEETPDGPNLYLERDYDDRLVTDGSSCCCERGRGYRVWIEGHQTPSGHIHGHYIHLSEKR